jgi:hypothetical protein
MSEFSQPLKVRCLLLALALLHWHYCIGIFALALLLWRDLIGVIALALFVLCFDTAFDRCNYDIRLFNNSLLRSGNEYKFEAQR